MQQDFRGTGKDRPVMQLNSSLFSVCLNTDDKHLTKSQLRDTGLALKSEIKTFARAHSNVAAFHNALFHDGSRKVPETQSDRAAGNIVKFTFALIFAFFPLLIKTVK